MFLWVFFVVLIGFNLIVIDPLWSIINPHEYLLLGYQYTEPAGPKHRHSWRFLEETPNLRYTSTALIHLHQT
ncbi:hypothetical protein Bca4012_096425 [Brassica carinata]|uniref:(rape) hypothetical protein n=1 Tax=Brassica napus TaxID=3708 RepID=A0A816VKJ4_BRANA|nr:unnamed protein product [Brassica napus]